VRRLSVCVLGPAALLITTIALALTPLVDTAAAPTVPTSNTNSAAGDTTCLVSDAAITWGVKESLRSYISGTIAHGDWAVSDGARYETPNFGWSQGSGQLDNGRGILAFDGTIRFTGHDGILDTKLSALEIVFDGSTTAHLIFDVSGTTQDGIPVDESRVTFADIDTTELTVTGGSATLTTAPVTLTEAGSAAFGTYPAGEQLDPITVVFSASSDCIPAPQAVNPALARNTIVVIVVLAITAAAGIVFFVSRRRGEAT
jgi:hypothetical protein